MSHRLRYAPGKDMLSHRIHLRSAGSSPGCDLSRSVSEANIPRMDIEHDHTVAAKDGQYAPNVIGSRFELLVYFSIPVVPHLRGEFRRCCIEPSASEVEDEWRLDHRHLDDQQIVIPSDKLGNAELAYFPHVRVSETLIRISFTLVRGRIAVRLDRHKSGKGFAFGFVNDTVNSTAETTTETQISLRRIGRQAANSNVFPLDHPFIHNLFRHGADASGYRCTVPGHSSDGAGIHDLGRTSRHSRRLWRVGYPDRWKREAPCDLPARRRSLERRAHADRSRVAALPWTAGFLRQFDQFPRGFERSCAKKAEVVAKCDHLKNIRFAKSLPHAFSEHGAIQAANMLNSDAAIEMGLYVVRAFVRLTQWLSMQKAFAAKLDELEQRVGAHDEQLAAVIEALRLFTAPPSAAYNRKIGSPIENR